MVDIVDDAINADDRVFVKTIMPVNSKNVHEVFFEGLGFLAFITRATFPAFLKGDGTSLDFCPGQHNGSLMMDFNPVYVGVCLIIPPVFSSKLLFFHGLLSATACVPFGKPAPWVPWKAFDHRSHPSKAEGGCFVDVLPAKTDTLIPLLLVLSWSPVVAT